MALVLKSDHELVFALLYPLFLTCTVDVLPVSQPLASLSQPVQVLEREERWQCPGTYITNAPTLRLDPFPQPVQAISVPSRNLRVLGLQFRQIFARHEVAGARTGRVLYQREGV